MLMGRGGGEGGGDASAWCHFSGPVAVRSQTISLYFSAPKAPGARRRPLGEAEDMDGRAVRPGGGGLAQGRE